MNDTPPTGLTGELTRQLHAQVDQWHNAPLTLDDVQGKARTIRRRRTALTAGVAAAAVLAVMVPVGLAVNDPGSNRPSPSAPSPTEAVEPTPNPDGTFPLTLDVPEGDVPSTGYLTLDDRQFVTRDGTYDLPGNFVQIVRYGGGWVGIRAGDSQPTDARVVILDADFQEVTSVPAASSLVISADGSRVAWVEARGNGDDWTVVNAPADGGEPIRTPTHQFTQVEGFLAADAVATSRLDTPESTSYDQATPAGAFEAIPLEGYQFVSGVSEASGLVAGQTKFLGDSTCSEVRNTDTAQPRLVMETCDHQLGSFSPDGRWLIGYASYSDLGSPMLAILDAATGVPVVEYVSGHTRAEATTVLAAVWEDDDTVVAVVNQGGDQAVLRLEADGTATRVSDVRQEQMSVEFFLPQHPFGQ